MQYIPSSAFSVDVVRSLGAQADVQSAMGVLFFVAINQGILGTISVLQVMARVDFHLLVLRLAWCASLLGWRIV